MKGGEGWGAAPGRFAALSGQPRTFNPTFRTHERNFACRTLEANARTPFVLRIFASVRQAPMRCALESHGASKFLGSFITATMTLLLYYCDYF